MMIRIVLLFSCLLLSPVQAKAHKIHVFAWVSGETVTVESNFSGNKALLHGKVSVKNNQTGEVLLHGTGNSKGIFTFLIPPQVRAEKTDLLIVVTGSEGHQSEWLVPATEYLLEETTEATSSSSVKLNNLELQEMIRDIIRQELEPIKRSLAENRQNKPGFNDIMGGIGYLLGLAGLVAWLRNRRPKEPKTDD